MLTLFFAICVGASFLLRVPVWKKIVLIVSAVPIAIVSNVARIALTGMLYEWVNKGVGNFIHDNAGWWMMILAMLMIWGEMALLSAPVDRSLDGRASFLRRLGRSVAAAKSLGWSGALGTPARQTAGFAAGVRRCRKASYETPWYAGAGVRSLPAGRGRRGKAWMSVECEIRSFRKSTFPRHDLCQATRV